MSKDDTLPLDDILSPKVKDLVSFNGQTANVEHMTSLATLLGLNHQFVGNETSKGDVNLGLQIRPEFSAPSEQSVAFSKGETGVLTSPATPAGNADITLNNDQAIDI